MLSTLIFGAFIVAAVIIGLMVISPKFNEKVTTTWGAAGAILGAIATYIISWWGGSPPELPM